MLLFALNTHLDTDEPLSLCGSAYNLIKYLSNSCMHSESHGATYGNVSVIIIIKVVCVAFGLVPEVKQVESFSLCSASGKKRFFSFLARHFLSSLRSQLM